MNESENRVREKPLGRGARFLLVMAAGLAMLSFYIFSLLAITFLVGLILLELMLALVAARVGAVRVVGRLMQRHINVLMLFLRSLKLQKGLEFRIPLTRKDAPGLHDLVASLCTRLEINAPQDVSLLMGDAAWVQLKGLRAGSGKTILGVGYDLLAGMSVAEMEAVLAHEMTHAKLIHRGFRNWLWGAQARVRKLAMALWADVSVTRRAKKSSLVAGGLYVVVDRLLRICTHLIATYSRQDEFEADWGAAELCGGLVMKSALAKLDSLHAVTSRLPWNERVAQLQQAGGYSKWLRHEIEKGGTAKVESTAEVLFNKYSTHPSIPDRLAALPDSGEVSAADGKCAIELLEEPDKIASELVVELQRLLVEQEKKDSRALEKLSKKSGRSTHLTTAQGWGAALIILGVMFGLVCLGSHRTQKDEVWCVAGLVGGVAACAMGKHRDRLKLPVPRYEDVVEAKKAKATDGDAKEKEKAIQAELANQCGGLAGKKRALKLAEESYAALKNCDYLRAHAAARECLKADKKSVEGALSLAVACAAYGQIADTARLLAFVQARTGFKSFSTGWGVAWAGLLAGDWIRAEAMLEKALKMEPEQTELVSFLALAQSRRGKLQSAITNARRACALFPDSGARLKFLIGRLLDGGFTHEAKELIRRMSAEMEKDPEVMLSMAQFHLLTHNAGEADSWTEKLKAASGSAQMRIRAARFYESARHADKAEALYLEALADGHYPEAHLGLGRIETVRNNKLDARRHTLAALNVEQTVGKDGAATWQVFHPILSQMLTLQEPIANCEAWTFVFPLGYQPAALAGQTLLVYGSGRQEAEEHFHAVMNALQPGKPPMIWDAKSWKLAPRQMQPAGPARPGVQGLWR